MNGYNVFFPIGFDAFGLPAENAAIKSGVHPRDWTMQNIEHMRRQLRSMGAMFDWDTRSSPASPTYYRWNQWFFLQFLEHGLAYRPMAPVDWCPKDRGAGARAGRWAPTGSAGAAARRSIKRDLEQWFFRITKYADELLDFNGIDWPEPIRVHADQLDRPVARAPRSSSRRRRRPPRRRRARSASSPPGRTRCSARRSWCWRPEHPLVDELTAPRAPGRGRGVHRAGAGARPRSSGCRPIARRPACCIGADAINPVNGERIPIWIADYVLAGYGTGAIMAVPAHDERDFAFARKFGLPIRRVVAPAGGRRRRALDDAYVAHTRRRGAGQLRASSAACPPPRAVGRSSTA